MGEWDAWIGRTEILTDQCALVPVRALAASLNMPVDQNNGDPLPELWHWLSFLPLAPMSEVGPDGHPKRGGFLPPVLLERRMWAGGRLTFHAPLIIGEAIEKRSEILKIAKKPGAAGPMVFVTVRHDIHGANGLCVSEQQDIVYLAAPKAFSPPKPVPLPEDTNWSEARPIDPVLLFRFSALTFNGHRIHYDRDYAMGVEHYPGLVVHGPLQAILLIEAGKAHSPGEQPASFSFRGIRPMFDFDLIKASGRNRDKGTLELFTSNAEGFIGMQAELHLR